MIADVSVRLYQPHTVQPPKALGISCVSIDRDYLVADVLCKAGMHL